MFSPELLRQTMLCVRGARWLAGHVLAHKIAAPPACRCRYRNRRQGRIHICPCGACWHSWQSRRSPRHLSPRWPHIWRDALTHTLSFTPTDLLFSCSSFYRWAYCLPHYQLMLTKSIQMDVGLFVWPCYSFKNYWTDLHTGFCETISIVPRRFIAT